MKTTFKLLLALALIAGVWAGQHLLASMHTVPAASAACFGGWGGCGMDPTRTSTLRVIHETTDFVPVPVVPDTEDVWYVTATYSPTTPPACSDVPFYATITVTNNGNGYTVSCVGCAAAPFSGVGICAPTLCASGTDNEYTLKLDLTQTLGTLEEIRRVDYVSTSIDDGEEIDSSCSPGSGVTPTSQDWAAADTTFQCSLDCTNDTLVTITYE